MDSALAPSQKLESACVVFTGRLASLSRQEAHQIVVDAGGKVSPSVNRTTTLLVVGMDGWPLLADGKISNKLARAQELNRRSSKVRVVSEEEFLELAGLRQKQPSLRKCYDADAICEIVGLDHDQLRRWEFAGLLRAHDGLYDFRDIVSLRTIVELVNKGVPAQTISRSIRQLAAVLPDTDRPLAQLKIINEPSGRLLAEVGGVLVQPDGQTVMRFGAVAEEADDAPLPIQATLADDALDANDWFERGVDLEEQEQHEDALQAYRQAVLLQPQFPEAHFNLSNVLLALNKTDAAEERLRMAVEQDPQMAIAWFNLGGLLESRQNLAEAVKCLQRAVAINPSYLDAHFNLASCYERLGQSANAAHHWRIYLQHDGDSEFAEYARRCLASA